MIGIACKVGIAKVGQSPRIFTTQGRFKTFARFCFVTPFQVSVAQPKVDRTRRGRKTLEELPGQ